MNFKSSLLVGMMMWCFIGNAQHQHSHLKGEQCEFDHRHQRLFEKDEDYRTRYLLNQKKIKEIIDNKGFKKSNTVYSVPVVVHVLHLGESEGTGTNISDAQIESAIDNLTDVYRNTDNNSIDIHIEFELAVRDPDCNTTTGINRVDLSSFCSGGDCYDTEGITDNNEVAVKNQSKWSKDHYYNIWVVSEIDGNNGGAGTQGYAYFPGASSDYDGSVMLYNAFGYDPDATLGYNLKSYTNDNSTAVHELGHALNLYHTFQGDAGGGSCPSDGDCGTNGDCIGDTEVHRRHSSTCPTGTNNTCTGATIGSSVLNNFMNYSSCPSLFTDDQRTRMRAALEGTRKSLTTSLALTTAPTTAPNTKTNSCEPTTSSTGLSGGFGGIMSVSYASVISNSSYAEEDATEYGANGYVDLATDCNSYAEVTVGDVFDVEVETWYNDHQVLVYVDWDNSGVFDTDELELTLDITGAANGGDDTATGSITVPSDATTDEYLRIRFNSDIGTVSNACENSFYGQIEDYALYVNPTGLSSNKVNLDIIESSKTERILQWSEEEYFDTKSYQIQSSLDGINFETIDEIESFEANYHFSHKTNEEKLYYRVLALKSNEQYVRSNVKFSKINVDVQFTIFPNPAENVLNVSSEINNGQLTIFDIYGKQLWQYSGALNSKQINLSEFPKGTYVIQIKTDYRVEQQKFIIK